MHTYKTLEAIDLVRDEEKPKQSFVQMVAKDAMVPLNKIFTLCADRQLSQAIVRCIAKKGFSRVPVFENEKDHKVIGLLYTRHLLNLSFNQEKTLSELLDERVISLQKVHLIEANTPFEKAVEFFRKENSHMAMVVDYEGATENVIENHLNRYYHKQYLVIGLLTPKDLILKLPPPDQDTKVIEFIDDSDDDTESISIDHKSLSVFMNEHRERINSIVDAELEGIFHEARDTHTSIEE